MAEEVELLKMKAALVVAGAAELEKKWEEEVAGEEDRPLQEVAAQASMRLVEGEVVRMSAGEVVAAFLQQQGSRLGKKNLSGVVAEGHQNEQAVEAVQKIRACPRMEVAHGTCLLKVVESQHRLPVESSVDAVGEADQVSDQE